MQFNNPNIGHAILNFWLFCSLLVTLVLIRYQHSHEKIPSDNDLSGVPDGAHFHSLIYRRMISWAEAYEVKDTASYAKKPHL